MLLIVAGRHDEAARRLAEAWSSVDTALLTPASLSVQGWRHQVGVPQDDRIMLGPGRTLEAAQLRAVYTRLPHVDAWELPHIVEADRDYVAAEMTAFLLGWLAELPCRTVNRPTPTCLAGPYWRPERWAHAAAALGMLVRPVEREEPGGAPRPWGAGTVAVAVVGEHWYGPVDAATGRQAVSLARFAGADILQTFFERGPDGTLRFAGADLWPDLSVPAVNAALLGRLLDP
jgi:hypothetical protein